eukprot:UN25395
MEFEPLDTNDLDMTATGKERVEDYLRLSEDTSDKEMLEKLSQCNGNHYWTQAEKECLIYFLKRCGNDMDKLQEDYFPHRTVGALKTRYTKIIRGEGKCMHTLVDVYWGFQHISFVGFNFSMSFFAAKFEQQDRIFNNIT